jgi:hypothetical protein
MHTTNYYNTFIEIAEDCPIQSAEIPPVKKETPSIANLQFDRIMEHPYLFTSDDLLFAIHRERNGLTSNLEQERALYFSKGQACLRSSPLAKRYGWGIHHNNEGKVALYAAESAAYEQLANDPGVKHVKAMRSKRVS